MADLEKAMELQKLRDSPPGGKSYFAEPADDKLPRMGKNGFYCPHCGDQAQQNWGELTTKIYEVLAKKGDSRSVASLSVAICHTCCKYSLWLKDKMVYPAKSTAPRPSADMPDDVKADYMEAREVFELSPRAAGGLLRLAFGKLLLHVGASTNDLNEGIKDLVKKGLPFDEAEMMHVMRVFSNQTVHEGFVKLEDQADTVSFLFELLNNIVDALITRPKRFKTMFDKIPETKKSGIGQQKEAKK